MAIRNRKLFPALTTTNGTINCPDFCDPTCPYNCPDFFFFPPPPPQVPPPPRPLPLSAPDHPSQDNRIPPSLIIIVALLSGFFLIVGLIIARSSSWWPLRSNQPNPAAAADGDDDDDEELLDENRVDHPIWFIATVGLQQSIISSITVCKYRKGEGLIEGSDCSVCLNEFQEGETLRLLPKCSHAFHIHCIDTWLRSHTNCPLCRASIVSGTANLNPPGPTLEMVGLNGDAGMENSTQNVEMGENHGRFGVPETRTETEDEGEVAGADGEVILKVDAEFNRDSAYDQEAAKGSASADSLGTLSPFYVLRKSRSAQDQTVGMQVMVDEDEKVFNTRMCSSSIEQCLNNPGSVTIARSHSCSEGFFLSRDSRSCYDSALPS